MEEGSTGARKGNQAETLAFEKQLSTDENDKRMEREMDEIIKFAESYSSEGSRNHQEPETTLTDEELLSLLNDIESSNAELTKELDETDSDKNFYMSRIEQLRNQECEDRSRLFSQSKPELQNKKTEHEDDISVLLQELEQLVCTAGDPAESNSEDNKLKLGHMSSRVSLASDYEDLTDTMLSELGLE